MNSEKSDIKKLDFQDYINIVEDCGEKAFRAKQISEWLWKKHVKSFAEMTNLSTKLRDYLETSYYISTANIIKENIARDKTIKLAFQLGDNEIIESVLIPSKDRITACISSQVGCALACKFCATATMGFKRNLLFFEIYDQLVELETVAQKHFNKKISNVVLMGMGEPLLNYDEVKKAIDLMVSNDGLAMSPSRITLSTAGVIKGIMQLADDDAKYNLAISLHTADDKKRDLIMPLNKKSNLNELKKAIKYYHKKTSSRITYEYLFIDSFNDSLDDAAKLAEFCKISPCKINIIEYNPVEGSVFKPGSTAKMADFVKFMESKNLIVNVRRSMGADIDAACGQLALKVKNNTKQI